MKRKNISETIDNINPKYIDEATEYMGAKKTASKNMRHKWIAVAVCFALVLAIGFPFVKDRLLSPYLDNTVLALMLIEYDDSHWEIIEDDKSIKKFGLPTDITEDVIGKHIVYLKKYDPEAERGLFIVSNEVTNIELFEYKPAPYKAVRIFKDGDKYYYAWFCNYGVKTNESLPIQTAFDLYGIDEASDIISIAPIKRDNTWKTNGKAITDDAVISEFYTEITKLTTYSFDEYHDMVFADELQKAEDEGGVDIGPEPYNLLAEDSKKIVMETKDGLRFTIRYYPSYGWIEVTQTWSYYQMSPEIKKWFEDNIK